MTMYAKKSLGQHFLRSERALVAITTAGDLKKGETVLEIGPGEGALTEKLLAYSLQLTAIEKDDNLYEILKEKFKKEISTGKLTLIHGDILEYDLSQLQAKSYKLIANIPYNITGAIFRKFLETTHQPSKMVLLVQKEVAERITPRHRVSGRGLKESILSISIKAYGTPKIVEKVKAGSFAPAPKVDSAIIIIENISREFFKNVSEKEFFRMLQTGFSAKRKKLSSNLAKIYPKSEVGSAFKALLMDPNTRAEDLGVDNWKNLAKKLI